MRNLLKKNAFTLVEVLMAMGICVIGVCSIMVLFPVGATASRDAAMASYAANTAEQILSFAKMCIEEDTIDSTNPSSGYKAFNAFTGWTVTNTTTYSDGAPIEAAPEDIDDSDKAFNLKTEFNYSGKIASYIDTFLTNDGTTITPLHNGKVYHFDFTSGTGSDKYSDFNCYASIYAKPVYADAAKTVKMPFAAELHVEISWPADLDYSKRHKRDFSLNVFKAY
ncbi:MAG: type II secretion system GspH family protein [Lentisphaeria bacterium]|nr:type II secretion system GspH family protein [Lentisphaeria bacterium]